MTKAKKETRRPRTTQVCLKSTALLPDSGKPYLFTLLEPFNGTKKRMYKYIYFVNVWQMTDLSRFRNHIRDVFILSHNACDTRNILTSVIFLARK